MQIELNEKIGVTYDESLRQILRHDPDVIMIGEIRDRVTAKLALTCALTGHLVLTTIHAGSCLTTIKRLLNLEISTIDLEDVLIGILSQKMRYDKTGNRVILPEFIDHDNLIEYFNDEKFEYYSFDEANQELIHTGILHE